MKLILLLGILGAFVELGLATTKISIYTDMMGDIANINEKQDRASFVKKLTSKVRTVMDTQYSALNKKIQTKQFYHNLSEIEKTSISNILGKVMESQVKEIVDAWSEQIFRHIKTEAEYSLFVKQQTQFFLEHLIVIDMISHAFFKNILTNSGDVEVQNKVCKAATDEILTSIETSHVKHTQIPKYYAVHLDGYLMQLKNGIGHEAELYSQHAMTPQADEHIASSKQIFELAGSKYVIVHKHMLMVNCVPAMQEYSASKTTTNKENLRSLMKAQCEKHLHSLAELLNHQIMAMKSAITTEQGFKEITLPAPDFAAVFHKYKGKTPNLNLKVWEPATEQLRTIKKYVLRQSEHFSKKAIDELKTINMERAFKDRTMVNLIQGNTSLLNDIRSLKVESGPPPQLCDLPNMTVHYKELENQLNSKLEEIYNGYVRIQKMKQ